MHVTDLSFFNSSKKNPPLHRNHAAECTVCCINKGATPGLHVQVFCVVFCLCTLLVGWGRMRSHPSPANSHQSGPMLEPQREEAIAHSTGAHSPSTQGGQGHLTHQGPVYFSLLSRATVHVCVYSGVCFCHCVRTRVLCVC